MSVDIHLVPYQQTFSLSKDFIRKDLAKSLFAEAIELDPDAKEISITNPVITPKVLSCFVDLSQGKEPIQHNPDFASAGHYLNIDVLSAYADPLYDRVRLQVTPDRLRYIITENRAPLLRYIIRRHPDIDYTPYLSIAFTYNVRNVAEVLLETFPKLRTTALDLVLEVNHYEMLQLVVVYPDIDLLKAECLLKVVRAGACESLSLLLKTILARGQERQLRAMQLPVDSEHHAYVMHPNRPVLLDLYLEAINRRHFKCLAVLIGIFPLNSEDELTMQRALHEVEQALLRKTQYGGYY